MIESCGAALAVAAGRWPRRTALIDPLHRLTFAQLHALVLVRCRLLVDAGVRPGHRVLLQLDNGADLAAMILAAWRIGAVAVPVVTLFRVHELTTVVREVRPTVVVCAATRGDRRPVEEMDEALESNGHHPAGRFSVGGEHAGWQALPSPGVMSAASADGQVAPPLPEPASGGSDIAILFTSGTTSEPKGVRHGSRSLLAAAETYRRSARLGERDNVLVPTPMAHAGGLVCGTLLPSLVGSAAVLVPRWDVGPAAATMAAEGVTFVAAAVPILADLIDLYERRSGGYRLAMFHTGAAPASPDLIERADRCGVTAWRSWGMTECPNATVSGRDAALTDRAATDGLIEPGVEVDAVDQNLRPVPAGTTGELRVRGAKLMLGYTAASLTDSIDHEGWFLTGDIGTVRPDGRVTVTGRTKDVISRGGEKFSAEEIEVAIGTHAAIADVAVVGRPDDRLANRSSRSSCSRVTNTPAIRPSSLI